ncbi:MFS transporter [Limnochorda pilosa]|uniref:MFS transporter n=1 Tax=Limnochorda pilosa TaxID=1555112 RepID=A0A0K2SIS0_LIMPI|nr:MFS transporter [Limnochorda pilosa]BAS26922.1 MFS transporter [Limnochorda pilosa]
MREDRRAITFIVLLGVVSLFADMTYEGARSATGPFLLTLGASAGAVGVVAGLGEFVGYCVRLLSGLLTDRLGRYWVLTGVGYAVNLLAVPLLALAGRWEVAASLVVLERLGKAIRTPSRDVMLSFASSRVGRGFGFGLHEALDQVGGVVGPLLVAGALFAGDGYQRGFAILVVPALLALTTLTAARFIFPVPSRFEKEGETGQVEARGPEAGAVDRAGEAGRSAPQARAAGMRSLSRRFWLYVGFSAAATAGFAHFQLISFHIKSLGLMSDPLIPVSFAVAMGVDALAALAIGRIYDRVGLTAVLALPLGTIPATVLAFGGTAASAWAGLVVWGLVLGVQETIMRAAIADLTPAAVRGTAYGVFHAAFGAAWFLGSTAMGFLYDVSIPAVIAFSVMAQVVAIVVLLALRREPGEPAY